jgi:Cu+-exporting ATPase
MSLFSKKIDGEETVLHIEGMHCQSCVQRVERALKKTRGVSDVQVDLARGEARVIHAAGSASPADLSSAVESLGFRVL